MNDVYSDSDVYSDFVCETR